MATRAAERCRRKVLRHFPAGFRDETYLAWERGYKWEAHRRWHQQLDRDEFSRLMAGGDYLEVANRALRVESRTNLFLREDGVAGRRSAPRWAR